MAIAGDVQLKARGSSTHLAIVSANYMVRATWAKGYIIDVTVVVDVLNSDRKNRFGLDGFQVVFDLTDGADIVKTWNAKMTKDGSVCTACHKGFCAPVRSSSREQAIIYFGFEARLDLPPPRRALSLPSTLQVNGQVCVVDACFARDLADCRNDDFEEDDDFDTPHVDSVTDSSPEASDCNEPRRRRCSSAPPVLYHSFGLALSRDSRGGHNDKTHLATTPATVCADRMGHSDDWNCNWNDDEDQSIAETVRHRAEREQEQDVSAYPDREVKGSSDAVLTPPLSTTLSYPACCTPADSREFVHHPPASRKRKFFEDEETDHHSAVRGVFSESSIPAPEDAKTSSLRYPKSLQLDYYRRSKALKKRKYLHMDYLDSHFRSREQVILTSVLNDAAAPIVMEPNMFPYDTPRGVTHWTLWSRKWLQEDEVDEYVDAWIAQNLPEAVEWNHDDNMADGLSINLFHLHVYVRTPEQDTSRLSRTQPATRLGPS